MTELAERKRLHVLQVDLHRALVRAESMSMHERLSWLNEARDTLRSASRWLAVGTVAVGLLAASRGRKLARWIPTALTAWRWVRKLRVS